MKFYAIFLASILITSSLGLSNFDNAFAEKTHYNIWREEYPIQFYPNSDPLSWAIEFWENARQDLSFAVVSEKNDADIFIHLIKEKGEEWVGLAHGRLLLVEYGNSDCFNNWKPLNSFIVGKIMAHEIGHALGYSHEDQYDSVMHPGEIHYYNFERPTFDFSLEKGQAIWMPLCGSRKAATISYDMRDPENKNRFDFYFASSIDDADDFLRGTLPPNEYDSECGGRNVIKKTGTCDLYSNGVMALKSKSESESFDVRIEIKHPEVNNQQYYIYSEKPIRPWVYPKESMPTCAPGTKLVNNVCQEIPTLKPVQKLEQETVCGLGTVLKNGVCIVEESDLYEQKAKQAKSISDNNLESLYDKIFQLGQSLRQQFDKSDAQKKIDGSTCFLFWCW